MYMQSSRDELSLLDFFVICRENQGELGVIELIT